MITKSTKVCWWSQRSLFWVKHKIQFYKEVFRGIETKNLAPFHRRSKQHVGPIFSVMRLAREVTKPILGMQPATATLVSHGCPTISAFWCSLLYGWPLHRASSLRKQRMQQLKLPEALPKSTPGDYMPDLVLCAGTVAWRWNWVNAGPVAKCHA